MQSKRENELHVAIIMDGNGRWATRRGLPRVAGHRAGVTAARRVVERAPDVGIRWLTLYAFSSDNWRRPADEVKSIFWLLRAFLRLETQRLRARGARLEVIGRRDRLPRLLLREIVRAECATAKGRRLQLRVAIDYSSRDAITRAAVVVSNSLPREAEHSADAMGRMWPDFDAMDLDAALQEFRGRERRFGGVPAGSARSNAVPAAGTR